MAVSRVRPSRGLQRKAAGSGLPRFKTGQLVRGTVIKILGEGMIRARIRGHDLIASTSVTVSSGEDLLLRVVKTHPRPHLQVMDSLDGSTRFSGKMAQLIQTLLEQEIPITDNMVRMLSTADADRTITQLMQQVREHASFWRRFLWLADPQSKDQIQAVLAWLNTGKEIFSPAFLDQLAGEIGLRANLQTVTDPMRALGELPRLIHLITGNTDIASRVRHSLELHWQQWHFIRGLMWESGRWLGTYFPFWWQNANGVAALTYWQAGEKASDEEPARLSILMACRNGWTMHFLLDYRMKDLAGAIEVNRADLAQLVQNLLPEFYRQLRNNGYTQAGVRVNLVEDLAVDYARLFTSNNIQQTYAG